MSELDSPVNNTPYSKEELEHFKTLLTNQLQETQEEIEQQKESLQRINAQEDDESSSQTHHPGDRGSDEEEKENAYIMIQRNQQKIKKIKAALDRIDLGTYGVCEDTGKKIQKERLEAIPYTRYSVDAKKKDETSPPGPRV